MPNLTIDQVYRFRFTTSLNGVPTALLGTPVVSIYKDADLTQSIAGVTLTVNFDGVVGLNLVEINTSAAAFYTPLTDFSAVITTGTVGGLSVVGSVIDNFTIENEYPAPPDNADGLLARNIDGGSDGGRDVRQALSTLRNKQAIVAGVYTCYEQDDLTPLFEALVTTAPGNPLTSWSPTT